MTTGLNSVNTVSGIEWLNRNASFPALKTAAAKQDAVPGTGSCFRREIRTEEKRQHKNEADEAAVTVIDAIYRNSDFAMLAMMHRNILDPSGMQNVCGLVPERILY